MGRTENQGDPLFQITERSGSAVQLLDGMRQEGSGDLYSRIFDSPIFRRWLSTSSGLVGEWIHYGDIEPGSIQGNGQAGRNGAYHIDMKQIYSIIE